MENTLAALCSFVDDSAVATFGKAFLSSHFGTSDHQVAQKRGVAILSLGDASESVTVLGNDEEVFGSDGCDVAESQTLVILVDDVGRDLLAHDLVEDGVFFGYGCLSLSLLASFLSHCVCSFC